MVEYSEKITYAVETSTDYLLSSAKKLIYFVYLEGKKSLHPSSDVFL
jgi:hypothetical protein